MNIEKVRKILSDIQERGYYKILRMKDEFREKEMRERLKKSNQSVQLTSKACS